jgi:DNA polymerase (family 10)
MRLYEILYILNLHLKDAIKNNEKTAVFIKKAYDNVIETLSKSYCINDDITVTKINKLTLTDNMKYKISKIINENPAVNDKKLLRFKLELELSNVHGIGPKKAKQLIDLGLTNIKQLNNTYKQYVTSATLLLLKYKPDKYISHDIIEKLEPHLTQSTTEAIIVGSYRRNKPFSRDIDVMLISDNNDAIAQYINYISANKSNDIIVYLQGIDKVSFLFKNTLISPKYFKIDVFRTDVKYKTAMLLYSTGSKEFNIRVRKLALKMGYVLNQKGLFVNGKEIALTKEQDLFTILNIPYLHPSAR